MPCVCVLQCVLQYGSVKVQRIREFYLLWKNSVDSENYESFIYILFKLYMQV